MSRGSGIAEPFKLDLYPHQKILLKVGFEPWASGFRRDHTAHCATTTVQAFQNCVLFQQFTYTRVYGCSSKVSMIAARQDVMGLVPAAAGSFLKGLPH